MAETAASSQRQRDVCIVGGGPSGMILAINLAQSGLTVTIFEANVDYSKASRAVGHIPPVFPEFQKVGVLEQAKRASKETSGSIHFRRTSDHKIIETIPPMPGRPGPMVFPQSTLNRILIERIAELDDNVELLMGHQALGFGDRGHGKGVTIDVEDVRSNEKKTYSCKYLVGADGSKSFVRHTLGLSYEGRTLPFKLVAADVFYPFEKYGWEGANFMLDGENFGNIALIDEIEGETLWRVGIGFPLDMADEDIAKALPRKYKAMFPNDDGNALRYRHHTEPIPYKAHHFCAPTFKEGNVFLVGDAAHIANPFSGQALACGIFDASALSDCIVAVEKEEKSESLLDDWSNDRLMKYKKILDPLAKSCFEAVSHPDAESIGSRHPFLKLMKAGPGAGPPPSLATKVVGLDSWNAAVTV